MSFVTTEAMLEAADKGGYAIGAIDLSKNNALYVYVGGKGYAS